MAPSPAWNGGLARETDHDCTDGGYTTTLISLPPGDYELAAERVGGPEAIGMERVRPDDCTVDAGVSPAPWCPTLPLHFAPDDRQDVIVAMFCDPLRGTCP